MAGGGEAGAGVVAACLPEVGVGAGGKERRRVGGGEEARGFPKSIGGGENPLLEALYWNLLLSTSMGGCGGTCEVSHLIGR